MTCKIAALSPAEKTTMSGGLPLEIVERAGRIPSTDRTTRVYSPYLPNVPFGYIHANNARRAIAACAEYLPARSARHTQLAMLSAVYDYYSIKANAVDFPDEEILEDAIEGSDPTVVIALAQGVRAAKAARKAAAETAKAAKAAAAEAKAAAEAAAREAAESSTGNTSGEPRVPTVDTITVTADAPDAPDAPAPSVREIIAAIHLLKGKITPEEFDDLAGAVAALAPLSV